MVPLEERRQARPRGRCPGLGGASGAAIGGLCGLAVLACGALLPAGAAEAAAPAASATAYWHYRIVRGDTLIGVAGRHLGPAGSWRALQKINRVADPRRLVPGAELRIPLAWLRVQPVRAEVLHVLGSVQVQRGESAPELLAAGAMLGSGDLLLAGPEASLALRLADGSRLLVRPQSRVRFERLVHIGPDGVPDTRLRLDAGSVDARVAPAPGRRFDIRTPTANLGVRGTEFRTQVDADGRQTRLEVLAGAVAAAPGTAPAGAARRGAADGGGDGGPGSRVEAGYGVVLAAGAAPMAPRRLLAPPDLSGLAPRLERVPLRLSWAPLAGAGAYRAQVFALDEGRAPGAGTADRLLLDGRFPTTNAGWADLPDGRYELRVRGVDDQGLEGRDARQAFALKARPVPPFTRAPRADARVYGESVSLAWTEAGEAASYRLQLSEQADFGTLRADLAGLSGTEHALALPPGHYHWRLASVRADGDSGPFGDAQAFTLRPLPPAPPVQPPQLGDDALVLRWGAREDGQAYEWQLARDAGFADIVQQQRSERAEATLALPPPGRYHLRVRAVDADGMAGPWGSAQQFEVPHSRWWLLLPALLWLLVL